MRPRVGGVGERAGGVGGVKRRYYITVACWLYI